jgi:ubiquinol-cytochrome c reductase iron-sulfur subunit
MSIEMAIGAAFLASFAGAVALVIVYWSGRGHTQYEGIFLGVTLGGLALGIGLWGTYLLPVGNSVQQRERLASSEEERAAFRRDFESGERAITRRGALLTLLGMAGAGLGAVLLVPLRSLGPSPDDKLRRTPWFPGARVTTDDGSFITANTLGVGSILTVYPEGDTQPEWSQTVLIRVNERALRPRPGREDWAPAGYVAYSKLCTHAACPVGLYNASNHQLLCPCHQSLFDVLDGAKPVFGPATRSLPQLPLAFDNEGHLVAQSDYHEPVGAGFWDR